MPDPIRKITLSRIAAQWLAADPALAHECRAGEAFSASELHNALADASTVSYVTNPHFRTLDGAETLGIKAAPAPELPLFPAPARACSSFSQYWQAVTKNATTLRALCALNATGTLPET